MKKQFTIAAKLWWLIGTLLVALGAIIISTAISFKFVTDNNHQLIEREDPFQLKALEFKYDVLQVQQWLTDISATRGLDGLNDGFDEAEKYAKHAMGLIEELSRLDAGNDAFYNELKPTFSAYYNTGKKMAQAYVDEGPAGGNVMMESFDGAAAAMAEKVDILVEEAIQRKSTFYHQQQEIVLKTTTVTITLCVVLGLLMMFGMYFTMKAIRQLSRLKNEALRIADSDLTGESLATDRTDEVGQLSNAIERMKEHLTHSISNIAHGGNQLLESVETMKGVAQSTSDGVSRQRQEIEQVATAINEMTVTVQEVSRNTNEAATAAHNASEQVETGNHIVQQNVRAINSLASEVERAVNVVNQLENDSNEIGSILDVIRDIADRTNLLALNAAIESARAGEAGRGFAVVADEVRTLASRTQESTQEIQTMIEKLQTGARSAVEVMEQGKNQAQHSVEQAESAGNALGDIKAAVLTITEMSRQIASAVEEQTAVAEEINKNVVNISDAIEVTSQGADTATGSANNLDNLAKDLQTIVAKFKL